MVASEPDSLTAFAFSLASVLALLCTLLAPWPGQRELPVYEPTAKIERVTMWVRPALGLDLVEVRIVRRETGPHLTARLWRRAELWEPGALDVVLTQTDRELLPTEWRDVRERFDAIRFWRLPEEIPGGLDGVLWQLAAAAPGAEHTVRDGLGPSVAPVACRLLDLARLEGGPRC
jgi:hypothetical protein